MRGVGPMGHHTPLAMLAAQCNKLTSKTPPPLADAAVGKGFHPWKKCGQSVSVDESSSVGKGTTQQSGPNSPASVHSVHSPHQQPAHLSHNTNSSPAPNLSSGYSDRKSEYLKASSPHESQASHGSMPCAEPTLALYPGFTPSSTPNSHTHLQKTTEHVTSSASSSTVNGLSSVRFCHKLCHIQECGNCGDSSSCRL